MFIDKACRGQVAVLLKLNIELSLIKNKVSEPSLGLIRLQWWRDFFSNLYQDSKKADNHELKAYLESFIKENKSITYKDFDGLISSRELDFEPAPFNDAPELESYLKGASGGLNRIIVKSLGIELTPEIESLIAKTSIAWGISAILRSANSNYSKGREIFPQNMSKRQGLAKDDFGSFDFVKLSKPVVNELIELSRQRIAESEQLVGSLSKDSQKQLKFLTVYLELAKRHNKKIKANDNDVFTKGYRTELGFFDLLKLYLH